MEPSIITELLTYSKPAAEAAALFLLAGREIHTWVYRYERTMFYNAEYGVLFEEILKQYKIHKVFDFGALSEKAKDTYLQISESVSTTAKMEYYFSVLAHARDVRAVPKIVSETMTDADDLDCVNAVKAAMLKIGTGGLTKPLHISELSARAGDRWEKRLLDERKTYSLGIPVVDDSLRVKTGNTIFIVAPPKCGKTWMLVTIACHLAVGSKVLFVSAEMDPDDLYARISSKIANHDFSPLEYKDKCQELLTAWSKQLDRIHDRNLWTLKARGISLGGLISVCMEAKHNGFEVIIIDYIQRILHKAESQRVATMEISRELSNFSGQQNVLLIAASQANRMARQADKTQSFHAKESAAIEEDADAILSLTLKQKEGTFEEKAMIIDVVQRNGMCFDTTLNFDPTTGRLWQ